MKKRMIIALLALVATALPAGAQYHGHYPRAYLEGRPQPRTSIRYSSPNTYYGFRIGVNGATVKSDDARLDGGSMKSGLNVAAVAGIQLGMSAPIFFETGLAYTEKGGKGTYEGKKFTYGLNYLEVPLVLKYFVNVAPDITVQPFLGGYLAFGVGGKVKDYGSRAAYSSFSESNFNRFDGGLRVGCGLQMSVFCLEVGYDHGLSNICGDAFADSHTGTLFANIGVNF